MGPKRPRHSGLIPELLGTGMTDRVIEVEGMGWAWLGFEADKITKNHIETLMALPDYSEFMTKMVEIAENRDWWALKHTEDLTEAFIFVAGCCQADIVDTNGCLVQVRTDVTPVEIRRRHLEHIQLLLILPRNYNFQEIYHNTFGDIAKAIHDSVTIPVNSESRVALIAGADNFITVAYPPDTALSPNASGAASSGDVRLRNALFPNHTLPSETDKDPNNSKWSNNVIKMGRELKDMLNDPKVLAKDTCEQEFELFVGYMKSQSKNSLSHSDAGCKYLNEVKSMNWLATALQALITKNNLSGTSKVESGRTIQSLMQKGLIQQGYQENVQKGCSTSMRSCLDLLVNDQFSIELKTSRAGTSCTNPEDSLRKALIQNDKYVICVVYNIRVVLERDQKTFIGGTWLGPKLTHDKEPCLLLCRYSISEPGQEWGNEFYCYRGDGVYRAIVWLMLQKSESKLLSGTTFQDWLLKPTSENNVTLNTVARVRSFIYKSELGFYHKYPSRLVSLRPSLDCSLVYGIFVNWRS